MHRVQGALIERRATRPAPGLPALAGYVLVPARHGQCDALNAERGPHPTAVDSSCECPRRSSEATPLAAGRPRRLRHQLLEGSRRPPRDRGGDHRGVRLRVVPVLSGGRRSSE
ncbi:hypothetical protein PybrP1_002677 [[Pythium] brassicae (nom. inval.)]|nr:hypothetical protein PybrP1_002677 [[Pythium] brassicae (nom. inval.)]